MRQERPWFIVAAVLALMAIDMGLTPRIGAASTFKVLHRFKVADGEAPVAGVILDDAGNLYGTAFVGGNLKCHAPDGCGTVFKLDVTGTFTVLHRFHSRGLDGNYPNSALARDSVGNLYGTTQNGGNAGEGTVFKVSPTGTESVLYSSAGGTDGFPPLGVTLDPAGNLYGTTLLGGGSCPIGSSGCGTIFELDPTGKKSVLYSFTGGMDGAEPYASVIRDVAGNLYGTTHYEGDPSCFEGVGCGTVFKLDTSGTLTVMKIFTGGADGQFPGTGSLVMDTEGNVYGATLSGGGSSNCSYGCGVVFKLAPKPDGSWAYTTIHSFTNHPAAAPLGGMVFDSFGNLYGTSGGGPGGLVFKLSPPQAGGRWAYSTVYEFRGTPALNPTDSLVIDKAGNLYGTTQDCASSAHCYGVVFKITP